MIDRQAAIAALLDRFERPSHRGLIGDATAKGHADNPVCGDAVDAWLRLSAGTVEGARFDGRGCTISQALADAACEAIEGRSVESARRMDIAAVLELAGAGVVESRPECAAIGLRALRAALANASGVS